MKKIVIEASYVVKHRYFIEAGSEQEAIDAFNTNNLKYFDYKVLSEDITTVTELARWREARPPSGLVVDLNNEHGSMVSNYYTVADGVVTHHLGNTIIFD